MLGREKIPHFYSLYGSLKEIGMKDVVLHVFLFNINKRVQQVYLGFDKTQDNGTARLLTIPDNGLDFHRAENLSIVCLLFVNTLPLHIDLD